ncbi:uncharacterized protein STEHIDRAFT_51354 [Stereum hirsutum FP-91666 SS1]|uniref:uncharacterized protein n=1 Tax=Stereum hirsutum (strain FP-91666) TaxID=721885 RepID=UPI000440D98B|nr:uncharacterized protein STEHIDRAFT_51354 [Stereum hirsutum FP-91666 SS1]EIM90173.1 hypothetical protein STEHIDRAFT_51354 [Stereum hirsutum FP-91666 SS1]
MDVLHPPPSAGPSVSRLPPLTLSNPSMVKEHTPCTLHPSVLPPELACRLFYTMLAEARDWKRNKWWLFDRLVESPHRTSFFIRDTLGSRPEDQAWLKVTQFWYNGRETDPPSKFPSAMEEACSIIENVVNEEMRTRERLPLEWAGVPSSASDEPIWRANFAASNLYEGAKEGVGFHSDRLTTLGPYPTIASLSLGTPRVFRLRDVVPVDEKEKRTARTYNIPLSHNSLVIMHATAQERFKHSIPPQNTLDRFHPQFPPPSSLPSISFDPSNCRINITFRFYRPDYHPDTIPKCKCGIPTTLRPDMKMLKKGAQGLGQYRYWWTCAAGDQNEGKGCGFWKVMDAEAEGRGPFAKDMLPSVSSR